MPARTAVESNTGTLTAISASLPATYDEAGYSSTDVIFTSIGEIENHGPHGVTRQIITFTPVDTGVIAKMSGSKDYGNMDLTIGNLGTSNAGQQILKAASESNLHYSVRLTYPDGEVHYIDVIVYKFEYSGGGANDVDKVMCGFALSRAPVVVAAV